MLELLLTLIRRHILIALFLPFACSLTGAMLCGGDLDPDFTATQIGELLNANNANGQQVQTFGQIARGWTADVRAVTP